MEKGREEERRERVGPQLESALVSVWDASGNSLCGSGLVIRSDGYVATCAHVVACAVGQDHTLATAPNEQVSLRFLKSGEKVLARVVAWSPWHEHDLAVLQVEGGLPSGCTAMDMFDAPVEFGQEFRSYGFPKRGGYELGRWAYGTFQHPLPGGGRIQVHSDDLQVGDSGGPVQHSETGKIIGLVSAADAEQQRAFLVPVRHIVEVARSAGLEIPFNRTRRLFGPLTAGTEVTGFQSELESFLQEYLSVGQGSIPFRGRTDSLSKLDEWLEDPQVSRALMVEPAGRGKSALLAQWVNRVADDNRAAVVYVPISQRFGTNSTEAVLSLFGGRLRHLLAPDIPLPRSFTGWEKPIENLLRQDYLPPVDGPQTLVVVLDGLDELEGRGPDTDNDRESVKREETGENVSVELPLPPVFGENVKVLVSARPLALQQDSYFWTEKLKWSKSALKRIELPGLSRQGIGEIVAAMGMLSEEPTSHIDALDELVRLSQGEPLTIRLYMEALRDGEVSIEELPDLSPGAEAFLDRWFQEQEQDKEWGKIGRNERLWTLLYLLACAHGPISRADLTTFAAFSGEQLASSLDQEEAISKIERLVIGDGVKQGYVFQHPLLQDYVYKRRMNEKEQADWQQRYRRWGAAVMGELQAGKREFRSVPDYLLRHYVTHMTNRRDLVPEDEEVYALVNEAWMRAHEAVDPSHDSFLGDVRRVWRYADAQGLAQVNRGENPGTLGIQFKCALCFTSVASLSASLPPHLPALLLQEGKWTWAQALAAVYRIPNPIQRIWSKIALLDTASTIEFYEYSDILKLESDILNEIRIALAQSQKENSHDSSVTRDHEEVHYRSLNEYLKYVSKVNRIRDVYSVACEFMGLSWRIRLCAQISSQLPSQEDRIGALADVLNDFRRISPYGDIWRHGHWNSILESIASHLDIGVFDSAIRRTFHENNAQRDDSIDLLWRDTSGADRYETISRSKAQCLISIAYHIRSEQASQYLEICYNHCSTTSAFPQITTILAPKLYMKDIVIAANLLQEAATAITTGQRDKSPFRQRENPDKALDATATALAFLDYYSKRDLMANNVVLDSINKLPKSKNYNRQLILHRLIHGAASDDDRAKLVEAKEFADFNESIVHDYQPLAVLIDCLDVESLDQVSALMLQVLQDPTSYETERLIASPYLLPRIMQQLDPPRMRAFVSALSENWYHFAQCGLLLGLASVIDELHVEQREYAVELIRQRILYFDCCIPLLVSLAPYMNGEDISWIIAPDKYSTDAEYSIHTWREEVALQKIAPLLECNVLKDSIETLLTNISHTYDIEDAAKLAVLVSPNTCAALTYRQDVASFLYDRTHTIFDLSSRAKMVRELSGALRIHHSRPVAVALEEKITQQAQNHYQRLKQDFSMKVRYLYFLPFLQRIREAVQLWYSDSGHRIRKQNGAFKVLLDLLSRFPLFRSLLIVINALLGAWFGISKAIVRRAKRYFSIQREVSQEQETFEKLERLLNSLDNAQDKVENANPTWWHKMMAWFSELFSSLRQFTLWNQPAVWTEQLSSAMLKIAQDNEPISRWFLAFFKFVAKPTSNSESLSPESSSSRTSSQQDFKQILKEIQSEILEISQIEVSERRRAFESLYYSFLRALSKRNWRPLDCIEYRSLLRIGTTEVWQNVGIHILEEAIHSLLLWYRYNRFNHYWRHHNDRDFSVVCSILIPSVAEFRPDLLYKFQLLADNVEDRLGQAILYSELAYYAEEENRRQLLTKALVPASTLSRDAYWVTGNILYDAAAYVTSKQLPFLLDIFIEHIYKLNDFGKHAYLSYGEALLILSRRVADKKQLVESLLPVFPKLPNLGRQTFDKLMSQISDLIDQKMTVKLLIVFQHDDLSQFTDQRIYLIQHWRAMQRVTAYKTWQQVLQGLIHLPRQDFVDYVFFFSIIIWDLDHTQGVTQVAEALVEIGDWWQ